MQLWYEDSKRRFESKIIGYDSIKHFPVITMTRGRIILHKLVPRLSILDNYTFLVWKKNSETQFPLFYWF